VSGSTPFAKQTQGNSDQPGAFTFKPVYKISNTGGNAYRGKLLVLINEITFSNGEYAAMAYRAGGNTTIIGSTTAGAVGKNPQIVLPGGLTTTITAFATHYPDGTETQRVGIIPDIWAEPTIEGIRDGRDELLEMAIKLIHDL
jgi:C-terminal processing protease CtpA/Prc